MQAPYKVADDTYVLPTFMQVPIGVIYTNPMVIQAKEPVLVDTAPPSHRDEYLKAAFALVEPKDVRWIFLSHDDLDHVGNLMQVVEMCPNARIVTNFIAFARLAESGIHLPFPRMRWLNNGESLNVGDRTLVAVRPPLFDAPSTRGLWDPKSQVYYSVDCFGAPVPKNCEDVGDVPAGDYEHGFNFFNRMNHPWHEYVDPTKYLAVVDRVRKLNAKVIVSYHAPAARNRSEQLCNMIAAIGTMEALPHPNQNDLEQMMAAAAVHGATTH